MQPSRSRLATAHRAVLALCFSLALPLWAQQKPAAKDDLLDDTPPAKKSEPPKSPTPQSPTPKTDSPNTGGGASVPPTPTPAPAPKLTEPLIPSGDHAPHMSPNSVLIPHDHALFAPDPSYADKPYDPQAQLDIYGAKHPVPTQRPLLELGRELYQYGPFTTYPAVLGQTNPLYPQVLAFGDYRTAVAYNDNGDKEQAAWAHRLNLNVDVRLTGTERVHAFFRPFDKGNHFSRYDFAGENHSTDVNIDGNLDALFFEGDAGNILGGLTGTPAPFDLPVAGGLIPLLFQNGVWLEDAFTGMAFTLPARNSKELDISNFDITFFAGFDKVTSGAMPGEEGRAEIYGVTAFIEALQGYFELGYAYTYDRQNEGLDYHNFSIAYTRRYFNWFSNSLRLLAAAGQNPDDNRKQTADGFLILIENSLITSKPSTVVPYLNLFFGFDHPQSVARDAGAGGILKNTGINFETDGLTGFPKLDDTGFNTWGGALGLNLLSDKLDQQLVVELATVQAGGSLDRTASGNEYALGLRYQHPITNAVILRFDLMYGLREHAQDLSGARFEIRYKF